MKKLSDKEYIMQIYSDTNIYISKYITVKCASTEDIKDIMQNVYINFSERIKRRGQGHVLSPKNYLMRIAKDELSKYYKQKDIDINKKVNLNDDQIEGICGVDESFLMEEITENKMLCDNVWAIIKRKDDITIKIFTLRFMCDMQLSEIAGNLNISLSSVKNRLYGELGAIKNILEEGNFYEQERID